MAAVAALVSGGVYAAQAAPGDSSRASARFLSGTLLTSGGLLDAVAALGGMSASNVGSPTPDTQTGALDLGALSALTVTLPTGVTLPLSSFVALGAVNQYSQASDAGVSRAASGAVSNAGVVDLSGSGGFPANATIDLVGLLGNPASGVLSTANVSVGAVTGVAALDANTPGGPAVSCADVSAPVNCRGYNVANANLNLQSPLVGTMVNSINTELDTVSATVNGLSTTLTSSITGVVNSLLSALSGGGNDIAVTLNVDLRSALSSVLQGTMTQGGVTLNLSSGVITVDLATVIGGLNNRAPNTPLLSATVINTIVTDLNTILATLQTNINTVTSTALNSATVTIGGGICVALFGCNPPLGGKLSLNYSGTLADLASGSAVITASGTGAVPALLAPVLTLLTTTLGTTLGGVVTPVLNTALSDVGNATTAAVTTLSTALNPVLTLIGTVLGINLNVQEAGSTAGSFREVAVRATVLGGTAATVDLGRAEVGQNVKATLVAPTLTGITPNSGPAAGGTSVTLTGTGFTGATAVDFGGAAGTGLVVNSDTSITVVSPPHAAGPADVTVTTPSGTSLPQTFTFIPAPTVTGISPAFGPSAGGTIVTLTGTGFTPGTTSVTIDSTTIPAGSVTVNSATSLSFTTPAHLAAAVDVTATTPNGTSAPQTFTYLNGPNITGITPTSGPIVGGTAVTLTGTAFAVGSTSVDIGGIAIPAGSVTVNSATSLTFTTPAHAAGPVDVTATTADGTSGPLTYTYLNVPSLTGITPNTGPDAGGTSVTLTGTDLAEATKVTIDGVDVTTLTGVTPTSVTFVTPAHVAGAVGVTVTTPGGTSGPQTFTYVAGPVLPTLTGITPASGPQVGGTSVTLSGNNLGAATNVTIDGTDAGALTNVTPTSVTFTTPVHAPGAVDVTVTAPGGTSAPQVFTYLATPTFTGIVPNSGPIAGGTPVTLTGTGFTGATGVDFGGAAGTAVVVVNDTTITAVSPPHTLGAANVTVTAPGGTSPAQVFTYLAVPTTSGINPGAGPIAGGTPVTLTGTGFTGATGVDFGGTPGTNVSVVNDTTITVESPPHAAGAVGVSVTTPGGTSNAQTFVYFDTPTLTGIVPASGPIAGGTTVTLTGTGFSSSSTSVTIDGTVIPAGSVTVTSAASLTFSTPAHAAGAVAVTVTTPGGTSGPQTFTYVEAPTLTGITPTSGPAAGGTPVTLTGTGFTGATGVDFGGAAASSVVVVSDTSITVVSPPHSAGAAAVTVTTPGGASAPQTFTYLAAPTITGINPASGPIAGGTSVTITGTGFTGATGVDFGGAAGANLVVNSATSITVDSPPHALGAVDVTVTAPGGTSAPQTFVYFGIPTLTGIAPATGPTTGGTVVTLSGTGFSASNTSVTIDGTVIPAGSVTVNSATSLTFTTPAHAVGTVQVTVTTPGGTSGPMSYIYLVAPPVPTLTGIAPASGPVAGGTAVTLTGTGFTGATGVDFGGVAGASVVVVSDTSITVVSPPHSAGAATVTVTTPGGTSGGQTFTFIGGTPGVIAASLTPDHGTSLGGTSVTINGSGFLVGDTVTIDGVPVLPLSVLPTAIVITTPAHAPGVVDVVVSRGGSSSIPLVFTYDPATSIGEVAPGTGPVGGGNTVTITGSCFTAATAVLFGTSPASSFTVVNDTTITAVPPAGTAGAVDVIVVGAATCGTATDPGGYVYVQPPVTTGIAPSAGPETGGTVVTISGGGYTGTTSVTIDGVSVPFTVVDDNTITITTPAHVPGVAPIVVNGPGGSAAPVNFTFTAVSGVVTISGLTPTQGPVTGGTVVTITGSGFATATGATFDGLAGTSFRVDSNTQITVTTPPHAAAAVDVLVQAPDAAPAARAVSNAGRFTYVPVSTPAPSPSPSTASSSGTKPSSIASTGFDALGAPAWGGLMLLLGLGAVLIARRMKARV